MPITQNGSLKRDDNDSPVMGGISSVDGKTVISASFNPVTRRLLVDVPGAIGTVTSVSVVTANGFAGSVATATTTPAITLSTTLNTPVLAGNGTALIAATTTGSGSTVVLATSPTLVTPILGTPTSGTLTNCTGLPIVAGTTGTLTLARGGTGLTAISALSIWVANSANTLVEVTPTANQSIRINATGTAWEAYTPSAGASGITIGTTTITSGTNTRILYNNAGVVGEYTLTGTGTVVVMQTAPSFLTSITTPSVLASANDSGALGASGTAFSDLFLASGAVINFAAGNSVITHSSAVIEVTTGDLRVTTAGTNSASVVTVGGTQTLTNKTLTSSTNVLGGVTMTLGSDASYDMYYRNASGILTRIPNGTTGQVLTATTNAAPAFAAGGGSANPGWDFVSYTTATAATEITVSSLDLVTDICYKIILEMVESGTNQSATPFVRINGITTSTYNYMGSYNIFSGGSISTGLTSFGANGTRAYLISTGNPHSWRSEFIFNMLGVSGGTKRVVGAHLSSGTSNTNDEMQTAQGTITETSQTNMTSILFGDLSTTKDWKVWVFKAATS